MTSRDPLHKLREPVVTSVVRGNRFQDAAQQGAGFQWAMIENRKVMSPANGGRQADVGTVLSGGLITQRPQRADEIGRVDVAWNFHTASASSRTKCKRMIFGKGPGSPSPK